MIVSETTEHYAKLLTTEQRHQKDPAASLCKVLRRANDTMYERHGEDAKTTATIAQIEHDINGDPFCAWASVGDSSLHVYSPGQELQQVSYNENNEQQHVITNWLGKTELAVNPENSGYFQCQPGEIVVIMSDGIGDQLEWDTAAKVRLQGLLSSLPPNPTSEQLDDMARYITENFTDKKDDRSIILVPIPSHS